VGLQKLFVTTRRHNVTLNDISVDKVANVFRALRKEMNFFSRHETIKSVLIFENKGEIVGVSNPHPHCQIYAVDFTINVVQKELAAVAEYQKGKGQIFSAI
jgi:UDPglucose--hexose-1-phosphate uridylyltransferase